MIYKKTLLICFLLVCLVCIPKFAYDKPHKNTLTQEKLLQFTDYTKQVKKDWNVPGMAIAIVKDDQIIYAKGFGIRNESGAPVTAETVFDIASLTKSFTATILAIQINQNKYQWNSKVLNLYPQFALYDPVTTRVFEVRDLMAQNSGLPEGALDSLGNFGYSVEHIINSLKYIKPVAPFRTKFSYTNIFAEVARKIIESSSQNSYSDNIHKLIFQPLKMNNSYVVTDSALKNLNNIAHPYYEYNGVNYAYSNNNPYLTQEWALETGIAGGGIRSSANDMAKWLILNINNGRIYNQQIVESMNMQFLHSSQTLIKSETINHNMANSYTEGWFIDNEGYKPYPVLYHPGGGTGMHALMAYLPSEKLGIVILTNKYGNKAPEILYRKLFDLYLNRVTYKDWNKIFLHEKQLANKRWQRNNKRKECNSNQAENLEKYIGTYYNPIYGDLVISMNNNHLSLAIGPQDITWKLNACRKNILQATWPNPDGVNVPMLDKGQDLIKFTGSSDGVIQKMLIPYLNDDGSGIFIKKLVYPANK